MRVLVTAALTALCALAGAATASAGIPADPADGSGELTIDGTVAFHGHHGRADHGQSHPESC